MTNDPTVNHDDSPEALLAVFLEWAECQYERAVEQGMDEPTVLILDARHPVGRATAELVWGPRRIRRLIAEAEAGGSAPAGCFAAPAQEVAAILKAVDPEAPAHVMAAPPPGYFRVVILHKESVRYSHRPVP